MKARALSGGAWLALGLLAAGSGAAPILEPVDVRGDDDSQPATASRLLPYQPIAPLSGGQEAAPAASSPGDYLDLLPEPVPPLAPSAGLLAGLDTVSLRRRGGIGAASGPLTPPPRPANPAPWLLALGLALALGAYGLQLWRRRRYARAARARRHIPIVGKGNRSRRRRSPATTREPTAGAASARREAVAGRSSSTDDGRKRQRGNRRSRSGRSRRSRTRNGSGRDSPGRP